jgi:hypothetical protein
MNWIKNPTIPGVKRTSKRKIKKKGVEFPKIGM